jgi:DNA polymerase-4
MRKIIHIDMDCFYAAIEMRDHPELRGKPIAVGGQPDKRGVLCTCNYAAREFSLRSAMSSAHALRLCPDLIILPVDMAKYKAVSADIRLIFQQFTDLIEPLSLDEAYLDVSECADFRGSATLIAEEIRRQIAAEHQLTASAGVAPNKFLAKIASDWNKPNGQLVITPERVNAFVHALPVEKIHGVGKVTAHKLHMQGIKTCADVQALSLEYLREHFGKFGVQLYQRARGIDERPVKPDRLRKSLSVEETFERDLRNPDECLPALANIVYPEFRRRFARISGDSHVKSLFVKIKFADFSQTTIQGSFSGLALEGFTTLCAKGLQRKALPVRLLGLGVHLDENSHSRRMEQLSLPF